MKKMHFWVIFSIVFIFMFVSCGQEQKLEDTEKSRILTSVEFIGNANEVDNLIGKYNLSINSVGIWNDYMPGELPYSKRYSICPVWFLSNVEIPHIEVFAVITTDRITYTGLLQEIYGGGGTMYGDLFLKDFRPKNLRLNDGEEYMIEVLVKISGEYQTIVFEKQNVSTTW